MNNSRSGGAHREGHPQVGPGQWTRLRHQADDQGQEHQVATDLEDRRAGSEPLRPLEQGSQATLAVQARLPRQHPFRMGVLQRRSQSSEECRGQQGSGDPRQRDQVAGDQAGWRQRVREQSRWRGVQRVGGEELMEARRNRRARRHPIGHSQVCIHIRPGAVRYGFETQGGPRAGSEPSASSGELPQALVHQGFRSGSEGSLEALAQRVPSFPP